MLPADTVAPVPCATPATVAPVVSVLPEVRPVTVMVSREYRFHVKKPEAALVVLHLSAHVASVPFAIVCELSSVKVFGLVVVADVSVVSTLEPVLRAVTPLKSWQEVR
jgi:hypothetical protein